MMRDYLMLRNHKQVSYHCNNQVTFAPNIAVSDTTKQYRLTIICRLFEAGFINKIVLSTIFIINLS